MTEDKGLDPIENPDIEIIVLGTYPGPDSLITRKYYEKKSNNFWEILKSNLHNKVCSDDYETYKKELIENKIGIWDLIKECERKDREGLDHGKDKDININSCVFNEIEDFFEKHNKIKIIIFNGKRAFKIFNEQFSHLLNKKKILSFVLPSTSGVNNTNYKKEERRLLWSSLLSMLLTRK
jgi:hypoxanthine-DNA glycosylase